MDRPQVPALAIKPPIVQVAIDVLTLDEALHIAEAAVRADVDWLEVGTPLITFQGTRVIGTLAEAFPETPILADFKMMDGVRKYVMETAHQGGRLATICAVASDASLRAAVEAGRKSGVRIICDLYAAPSGPRRAREVVAFGVDSVYIHYGADERAEDPGRDPLLFLGDCTNLGVPVGVGTFSIQDGVRAMQGGADIVVLGVPLIHFDDPESALREYILKVKEAWYARKP
ncbi:MAG: orotidine 5'-phosphate decarboxylase / HUMPS family protein [Candidatus Zipacnadales bacterium]